MFSSIVAMDILLPATPSVHGQRVRWSHEQNFFRNKEMA
ncbi:hypothetical protein BURCENBC7_AP0566 [Burkholderia cenocepacia BC7]|jgi:hypothetical protein|nr:hypothetical protein BURCENBC7_AP0566 [Burkholderia cenocepacia BC7]